MCMLKIGVLGVGHLGKIHINCIQQIKSGYQLVGFYDPDDLNARQAIEKFGVKRFDNLEDLMDQVDVVDIVTPTVTHFDLAEKALHKGKHLFIEKPLTHTLAEAEKLVALSKEKNLKVQVGHVERFNPALLALGDLTLAPMFIEAHRLANFNPRGTDVSVVLDLMIHDLDILLSLVESEVTKVSASGVAVVSETPDISNARIEFANGCVANITASRISLKQMRKMRLFQRDAYISIDFLEKNTQVVRLYDEAFAKQQEDLDLFELETSQGKKYIHVDMPKTESVNAIKMELESLADSIHNNTLPKVSIEDGYKALRVAGEIINLIEEQNKELNKL